MIIVTGTAPRCGTSAMMRELIRSYKPHSSAEQHPSWTAPEMNPKGYWDLSLAYRDGDKPIVAEPNSVIKLWATQFHRVDPDAVSLVVVMRRSNFTHQVDSIIKTARAQGLPELTRAHISHMFLNQNQCLEKYFDTVPRLDILMEDFRDKPEYFIRQIKEVVPWAQ